MSGAMAGVMQNEQLVPAFTVEKLAGKFRRTLSIYDDKEHKLKHKEVEVDAGFLVKFAKGHSIRAFDKAHLERVGAGAKLIPLLDENGAVKGHVPNVIEDADEK